MKFSDPCQWNPEKDRALYESEEPHANAALIVGHGAAWRLCRSCSNLPHFSFFTKREEIKPRRQHTMPTETTITLPQLPQEQPNQERAALTIVDQAKALQIASQSSLEVARDFVRQINERIKWCKDHHAPMKSAAQASHKATVEAEKKVLGPLEEAKDIITNNANTYMREQERLAEIARKKAEEEAAKERQRKMDAAQKKIGTILGKVGADADHLQELQALLVSSEVSDEEAYVVRSQIAVLEAKIAGHQQRAAEIERQAAMAATVSTPAVAAAAPPKTAGVVSSKAVTVTVVDIKALCRGVADGILPPGVVKGVNKSLVALAKTGMNLAQFGCRVDEDKKSHFR